MKRALKWNSQNRLEVLVQDGVPALQQVYPLMSREQAQYWMKGLLIPGPVQWPAYAWGVL